MAGQPPSHAACCWSATATAPRAPSPCARVPMPWMPACGRRAPGAARLPATCSSRTWSSTARPASDLDAARPHRGGCPGPGRSSRPGSACVSRCRRSPARSWTLGPDGSRQEARLDLAWRPLQAGSKPAGGDVSRRIGAGPAGARPPWPTTHAVAAGESARPGPPGHRARSGSPSPDLALLRRALEHEPDMELVVRLPDLRTVTAGPPPWTACWSRARTCWCSRTGPAAGSPPASSDRRLAARDGPRVRPVRARPRRHRRVESLGEWVAPGARSARGTGEVRPCRAGRGPGPAPRARCRRTGSMRCRQVWRDMPPVSTQRAAARAGQPRIPRAAGGRRPAPAGPGGSGRAIARPCSPAARRGLALGDRQPAQPGAEHAGPASWWTPWCAGWPPRRTARTFRGPGARGREQLCRREPAAVPGAPYSGEDGRPARPGHRWNWQLDRTQRRPAAGRAGGPRATACIRARQLGRRGGASCAGPASAREGDLPVPSADSGLVSVEALERARCGP
jgi:hypothetical protein